MPVPDIGRAAAPRATGEHLSLADALDRILHRGVAVQGNLTIGLADVDLLFLDLRLLLGSVDTIWPDGPPGLPPVCPLTPSSPVPPSHPPPPTPQEMAPRGLAIGNGAASSLPVVSNDHPSAKGSSTAQGLVKLVLTLVKLLHEVLERQAVRRMEAGRLTDAQIDDVGMALFAQAEEISRLQQQFGLSGKDLSLNLGVPDGAL